jgi:hypothetical protein
VDGTTAMAMIRPLVDHESDTAVQTARWWTEGTTVTPFRTEASHLDSARAGCSHDLPTDPAVLAAPITCGDTMSTMASKMNLSWVTELVMVGLEGPRAAGDMTSESRSLRSTQ